MFLQASSPGEHRSFIRAAISKPLFSGRNPYGPHFVLLTNTSLVTVNFVWLVCGQWQAAFKKHTREKTDDPPGGKHLGKTRLRWTRTRKT